MRPWCDIMSSFAQQTYMDGFCESRRRVWTHAQKVETKRRGQMRRGKCEKMGWQEGWKLMWASWPLWQGKGISCSLRIMEERMTKIDKYWDVECLTGSEKENDDEAEESMEGRAENHKETSYWTEHVSVFLTLSPSSCVKSVHFASKQPEYQIQPPMSACLSQVIAFCCVFSS